MEKKTIGKFISALRKANGMTQKELGEKLFVSDKTVSRWECDECTPELSLIPSIAEIFGITTDELLRGERNNPDREIASEDMANKQKAKSDKQFKLMLDRNSRRYKNLTLISVGITILGFIAAIIANVGFSKGLIAFCLATAFCVASEICQICFTINARITSDEDDDTYTGRIQEANTSTIKTATTFTLVNLLVFAFCLPLVTLIDGANFGLVFESWLGYGCLFSAIAFVFVYIIYELFIRKALCKRELIFLSEKEKRIVRYNNILLKRVLAVSISIALVLGVATIVLNTISEQSSKPKEIKFDNWMDFKALVESDYDRWYEEGYSYIDENGDVVVAVPIVPDVEIGSSDNEKIDEDYYPSKVYEKYRNRSGEVIFEYYYNPDLYRNIWFHEADNGELEEITVITSNAYFGANEMTQTNDALIYVLFVLDFVVAMGIYVIKITNNKRKA